MDEFKFEEVLQRHLNKNKSVKPGSFQTNLVSRLSNGKRFAKKYVVPTTNTAKQNTQKSKIKKEKI
jgi:hypothetical protein